MDQFNEVFWNSAANGDFTAICAEIKKGVNVNYQNGEG